MYKLPKTYYHAYCAYCVDIVPIFPTARATWTRTWRATHRLWVRRARAAPPFRAQAGRASPRVRRREARRGSRRRTRRAAPHWPHHWAHASASQRVRVHHRSSIVAAHINLHRLLYCYCTSTIMSNATVIIQTVQSWKFRSKYLYLENLLCTVINLRNCAW